MKKNANKAENASDNKSSSTMNPVLKEILSWVEVIVVAVVLAWFITSFIIVNATVGKKTNYIKRVIGLPGETVEIKNASIYIDGQKLEEDYLKEEWIVRNDGYTFEVPEGCYLMLGDNRNNSLDARYWATEAVKDFSAAGKTISPEDAWSLSFVKKSQMLGKAYVRYWPITQISSLY